MNYEQAVIEIKELLSHVHTAWVDVLLRLRDVEQDGCWKIGGHAHFQDFLRSNFPNAIGFEKYNNGIRAIELYGEELVREVGVQAAHAMCVQSVASDGERVMAVAEHVRMHIAENGVAPGVDWIRKVVSQVAPESAKPMRLTRGVIEREQLRVELQNLKTENRALKTENRALKKEIASLSRKQPQPQPC